VAGATDGGGAPTGYARARAGEYAASAHKRRPLQQCSKGWQPSALHKQNWQTSHRGACRRTSSLLQRAGGEAVVSLQPGKQTRCVLERHYSFKGVPSKGQVRAFGLRSRQFVQGQIPCTLIRAFPCMSCHLLFPTCRQRLQLIRLSLLNLQQEHKAPCIPLHSLLRPRPLCALHAPLCPPCLSESQGVVPVLGVHLHIRACLGVQGTHPM